jgi:hypothetical protein
MTRFKELRRFEAALEGSTISEVEWAIAFAKKMLRAMKLKGSIDAWRKRREHAEKRYAELKETRRLTSA